MDSKTKVFKTRHPNRLDKLHSNNLSNHRMFKGHLVYIILLLALLQCYVEAEGDTEQAQPNTHLEPKVLYQDEVRELTPVLSTAAAVADGQSIRPFLGSNRQAKLDEGDGFIMRTGSSLSSNMEQYASDLGETKNGGKSDDELATTSQTTTAPDSSEQQTTTENDRIPINATRQQFLTHDQLVNASTKDEQIHVQQHMEDHLKSHPSPADASTSSRSGMPRLAFASSFLSGKCNHSQDLVSSSRINRSATSPARALLYDLETSATPTRVVERVAIMVFLLPVRYIDSSMTPQPKQKMKNCVRTSTGNRTKSSGRKRSLNLSSSFL